MNSVSVVGRLTNDIELRYLDNGTAVANFGLAVDGYKDHTHFFNVQVWGKTAEHCAEYIGKGRLVGITGELRQERWKKDGQNRSKVIINANNVKFLDYKDDNKDSGSDDIITDDELDTQVPF